MKNNLTVNYAMQLLENVPSLTVGNKADICLIFQQ